MAVVYDHAVTDARRLVERHRPEFRDEHVARCAAGCGRWPCKSFTHAWAVVTRNSNTRAAR